MLNCLNAKMQSGISLYLSLMVMTILLAMALGLSTIFLGQAKMIRKMGNSVIAFSAADAGIEKVLIDRNNPLSIPQIELANKATYQVFVYKGPKTPGGPEGNCTASGLHYCIKSVGIYKETKRAIEIVY